jgi:pimeloyl-ACP methyl ester carboxylesterase
MQQAELLHKALAQLGVERPVVVGHSWGAIVALSLAVRHPANTAGLVVLSGYYFWTLRPDVLLAAAGAVPVAGDMLRYTVSPLLGWLMMPLMKRAMFSPAPVSSCFQADYSNAMALRPSQIRASSGDGALMIPGALSLRRHYGALSMPVVIMAGDGDKVVSKRAAERLHACVPGSVLRVVKGAGHMVHHFVPGKVVEAIQLVTGASQSIAGSGRRVDPDGQPEAGTGARAKAGAILQRQLISALLSHPR